MLVVAIALYVYQMHSKVGDKMVIDEHQIKVVNDSDALFKTGSNLFFKGKILKDAKLILDQKLTDS